MRQIIILCMVAMIASCGMKQEPSPGTKASRKKEYFKKGQDIVELSQAELLKNVSLAMASGGPGNAVDFCNVHALSIKDSLSLRFACEIRRIAVKYRNPEDMPRTETETELLDRYAQAALRGDSLQAEVIMFDDRVEYYHPIFIDKGACLLCHGIPGEQISAQTMEMINTHYPGDLAREFAMGDFRGAWKITFRK